MSMTAPIIIDIGPTERRTFAGPRNLFQSLANPHIATEVVSLENTRAFSQCIARTPIHDHDMIGYTIKVAGSDVILDPRYQGFEETIRHCAIDHSKNTDFDYA